MKKACVAFAAGCPRSQIDCSKLVEYLKANQWKLTNNLRIADLVLLSTCGSDKFTEETSYKFLSLTLKRTKIDAEVIVIGCLAEINKEHITKWFGVKTITPKNLEDLDRIINAKIELKKIPDFNRADIYKKNSKNVYNGYDRLKVKFQLATEFPRRCLGKIPYRARVKPLHTKYDKLYDIKVANGCLGKCTYCAIRYAEGTLISKPIDKVLSEFESGLKQGNNFFRLIAGDVGAYGQDIGTNISDLLMEIFKYHFDFKLMWDDFNPKWLIKFFPSLFKILVENSDRIGYLGFPIQTGSEKIIRLMERGHTIEDAKSCLQEFQIISPQIIKSTHILVGFPGETDDNFEETLCLLRTVKFNHISLFKYDDRPGTKASKNIDKVDERVQYKRLFKLTKEFKNMCLIC